MANTFGDIVDQLKSLFGRGGDNVPDRQGFSSAPARENMALQNEAAAQAGWQTLNQSKEAARFGSQLSDSSYTNRLLNDYNQAVRLRDLNRSAGGGAAMAGKGAWTNTNVLADPYGMSGTKVDFQGLKQFSDRQGMSAQSELLFGSIAARNEGARVRETAMAQLQADQQRQGMNIDMMNRQASIDSQRAAQDRLGQQAIARTQAQASVLSSLFGSVGAGSPNYRYWG